MRGSGVRNFTVFSISPLYCLSHFCDTPSYLSRSIIVVQFDGDEDDKGIVPQRHIPARFVTLIPREFPAYQLKKKRKSTTLSTAMTSLDGDETSSKKKASNSNTLIPRASSAPRPNAANSSESTLVDDRLSQMYGGGSRPEMNLSNIFLSAPRGSPKLAAAATARQAESPLKLPPKRKSSQAKIPKRMKKQKQKDNNLSLASPH